MTDDPKPSISLTDDQFSKVMATLERVDEDALRRGAEELKALVSRMETDREIVRMALLILLRLGVAAVA